LRRRPAAASPLDEHFPDEIVLEDGHHRLVPVAETIIFSASRTFQFVNLRIRT